MKKSRSVLPIGSVIHSMLTLAQFQTVMGNGWVLANGQSCVGTAYGNLTGATIVPDMRGSVLRGKNNGSARNPDGDVALGTYQADMYGSHTHIQDSHTHAVYEASSTAGTSTYPATPYMGSPGVDSNATGGAIATNQNSGGNETRMKNVTVNIFMRVN